MPPPFRSVVIPNEVATFACQEPGCRSQPFKRIGDLNRHNRKHSDSAVRFHCPASGCRRKGKQGFSRRDKLTDHMLAGHNEDDWFSCASCGVQFERAEYQFHDETARLQYNRTCPMPRCSFKVFTGHDEDQELKLEMLQEHLLAKHDLKARSNFSELLGRRGYEARSGEIICPVCSPPCLFKNHGDFEGHFMHTHFQGTVFSRHEDGSCEATCFGYNAYRSLAECTSIPEEVRQHRLAILRIMPVFADFPVWDDITPCSGRA
ncbi:hypothetical protein IQ06DRAFT_763 [Phaeosphaeriaceae sp. SRC1lsM3a]|nr:hypothetical protein IQ06DRAFT_763 [Stagonospora sp. SRC1lsM3a]